MALAGLFVAQLEVFLSSDNLWVMSPFVLSRYVRLFLCVNALHTLWSLHASFTRLMFYQQQNQGWRFGASNNHLASPVASVLRRRCCVCWFIFYCCSHCVWKFCVWSLLCHAVLSVLSSFAIICLCCFTLIVFLLSRGYWCFCITSKRFILSWKADYLEWQGTSRSCKDLYKYACCIWNISWYVGLIFESL